MEHHEFHPDELNVNARVRENWRGVSGWDTERLDRAQSLLRSALAKEGHEALTKDNFEKVMEQVHKDPGFHYLYSSGPTLEEHLRTHLNLPAKD